MNWSNIFQTLWNAALQFGAAYGAAWSGGATGKTAVGAGLAALATGQIALQQTAPKDQPTVAATK